MCLRDVVIRVAELLLFAYKQAEQGWLAAQVSRPFRAGTWSVSAECRGLRRRLRTTAAQRI